MIPTMKSARQLLPVLAAPLATASAAPQDAFDAPEVFARNLDFAYEVLAVDPDLDGDADVLVSTLGDGVRYIESTGAGQARLPVLSSPDDVRHALAHDVDGDGAVDLVGTRDGVGVVVHHHRYGAYAAEEVLVPGGLPLAPAGFVDVDRDGTEDLVLAGVAGPGLGWCRGLGGSSFGAIQALWPHAESVSAAATADLDGDGDLDLVAIAEGPDRVLAAINDPAPGGMTRATIGTLPGSLVASFRTPVTGDLDGDGLPEVLVRASGGVHGFANLGGLSFGPGVRTSFSDGAPHLVDADRDGDLDLFIASSHSTIQTNDGTGALSAPVALSATGGHWYSAAWGDQDGDGWPDLVSTTWSWYGLAWWRNDGSATAPFVDLDFAFGGAPRQVCDVALLDADDDGDMDVVALDRDTGDVQFYGTAGGAPVDTVRSHRMGSASVPDAIRAGDLDGDGLPDLVTTALNEVTIWRGQGDGSFQQTGTRPFSVTGTSSARIRAGELSDLDADGHLDLVVSVSNGAYNSPSRVVWCAGDGAGDFGPEQAIAQPVIGQVAAPRVADLDGDGRLDVTASVDVGQRILAWMGQGAGAFGPQTTLVGGASVIDYALGDLDLDGDVDAVVLQGPFPGRITWHPGGGSPGGGFLVDAPLATGLRISDADRDGRPDLVLRRRVANGSNSFEFAWIHQPDLLAFDPLESLPGEFEHEPAWRIGDIDGDDDEDVIWATVATNLSRPSEVGIQRNLALGPVGEVYCDAVPNSSGRPGELRALGSVSLAARRVRLTAHALPPQQTVLFVAGRSRADVFPVGSSVGRLCLGGALGRFDGPGQIRTSGASGEATLRLPVGQLPTPAGPIPAMVGANWTFQAWHRDTVGGAATSNFTRAVELQFVP